MHRFFGLETNTKCDVQLFATAKRYGDGKGTRSEGSPTRPRGESSVWGTIVKKSSVESVGLTLVCSPFVPFSLSITSLVSNQQQRHSYLRMKRDRRKMWMKWLNKCNKKQKRGTVSNPLPKKTASKFKFTSSRTSASVSLCFFTF